MKKILLTLSSLLIYTITFAQVASNTASNSSQNRTNTSPKINLTTSNTLMDRFKDQVEDWNVGNLHVHMRSSETAIADYKYQGEKSDSEFHRLLPQKMQNRVIRGYDVAVVAELKGSSLESDMFIMRSNQGTAATDELLLFRSKNDRLKKAATLAFHRKKGNTWQQLDTWIKDVNRDGRLDLVQKKQVTDMSGKVLKTKMTVLLMTPKGKFKKTKKFRLDSSDFSPEDLKK